MRAWHITRDEAELLVDVLEGEMEHSQDQRAIELAAELRQLFGMSTREQSIEYMKAQNIKAQKDPK